MQHRVELVCLEDIFKCTGYCDVGDDCELKISALSEGTELFAKKVGLRLGTNGSNDGVSLVQKLFENSDGHETVCSGE